MPQGLAAMRRSRLADFPVNRPGHEVEEIVVLGRLAPALGLMVILAPATALAQVNIDQDKSPAQLYAGDCAACHKSVRGLANGRSASSLAGFLGEHYTASSREAAAIAAYVMASGGGAASPAPSRARPEGERTRANIEQPGNHEAHRPVQPEDKPAGNAAARRSEPERRAAVEPGQAVQPGAVRGPLPERHERGATRPRGRAKPLEAVSPPPAPPPPAPSPEAEAKTAVAAPPPAQAAAPAPEASPAGTAEPKAAAPAQPGEATAVPRDNIPD